MMVNPMLLIFNFYQNVFELGILNFLSEVDIYGSVSG